MKTEQKPNRPLHIATEVFRWLSSVYFFPGAITDVVAETNTAMVTKKTESDHKDIVIEKSK